MSEFQPIEQRIANELPPEPVIDVKRRGFYVSRPWFVLACVCVVLLASGGGWWMWKSAKIAEEARIDAMIRHGDMIRMQDERRDAESKREMWELIEKGRQREADRLKLHPLPTPIIIYPRRDYP